MIRDSILKESIKPEIVKKKKKPTKSKLAPTDGQNIRDSNLTDHSEIFEDILEEKLFADTRKTKDVFGKYLMIRIVLAQTLTQNTLIGLQIYEYIYLDASNNTAAATFLSIINTVGAIIGIMLWILSLFVYARLKREKLLLDSKTSFLKDYGYGKFFFVLLLMCIHPFIAFFDVPFFWEESYFEPDTTFSTFKRPTIEYWIIIQFCVNISFIMIILLENVKYGNNRSDRIARFFGIDAGTVYIMRAVMKAYPLILVGILEVFGVVFFGVIVRIAEAGYLKEINIDPAVDPDGYQALFDERSVFLNYNNSFWNMIITMTTIGYGDIYVRSTFARFMIIITGSYGILVTSLMVVAFTNLLEMEKDENEAFSIILSIQKKKEKDEAAIYLTSNILRAGLAYFKGDNSHKDEFKQKFNIDVKNFIEIFNDYRTMNVDETAFINTKAFQIFSNLNKWDLPKSIVDKPIEYEELED